METNVNFETLVPCEMEGIEIELQCIAVEDYAAHAVQHRQTLPTRAMMGVGINVARDNKPVLLLSFFHPDSGVMTGVLGEQSIDLIAHKIADHISSQNAAIKSRNAVPPRLVQ